MAAAVLAVGCGGGGDGGEVVVPVPTPVKISAANQDAVATASIASIMPFVTVPVLATSPSPGLAKATQAGSVSASSGRGGLTRLALRAVDFGSRQTAPAGMARPLKQYQQVEPCLVSGTRTLTWDDNDNNGSPTGGDAISIAYSQCDDGDGQVVNGGMAMAIATYTYSLTPTAEAEDITGSMTFQSLTMVSSSDSYKLDGSAAFHINATETAEGYDMLGDFTVGSSGLTMASQSSTIGLSDTFTYRAGYKAIDHDFLSKVPGVPSWEVLSANGDFGSRALGGDLKLSTVTPFESSFLDPEGDIFPTKGQVLVTGGEGTKLRLTAIPAAQVLMEVSYDSDDDWEYTGTTDWPSLLP